MPHKRLDVAVEAFTTLGLPLTVVGKGPDLRRLKRMAGPTITFAGHLPDAEVEALLPTARALVVTATEEFGIAAVEAQAAGRPVIALRAGGVRETLVEGETGVFFEEPTASSLAEAVRTFDALAVDPGACVASARRFDVEVFRESFAAAVEDALASDRPALRVPRRRRLARNRSPRGDHEVRSA